MAIINVDLDNVVFDFYGTFARWLEENDYEPQWELVREREFGIKVWGFGNYERATDGLKPLSFIWSDGEQYAWPEPTQWEFWHDWDMSYGEWNNWFRRGVEYGHIWHTGRTVPGAVATLWRLSDAGHYIRLVTHRLVHKFGHRDAVVATANWLDRANVPYRDLIFMTDKQDLSGDFMLDDNIENIVSWVSGRDSWDGAYLFPTAANVGERDRVTPERVTDWPEFYEAVVSAE